MSDSVDITIIGAGVVGLAIAAQVAAPGRAVYVLEKNETFGQETSSRNSGVIHAGIYYPAGTLKARLCVEGNRMLYELCEEYDIAHRGLGKLIVAITDEEVDQLHALMAKGLRNGVEGLRMLSKRGLQESEPNVRGITALLSANTGIVDAYGLMSYLIAKARDKGARIAYKARAVGIDKAGDGYKIAVDNGSDGFTFSTRIVINCAGLSSDKIAAMSGIDVDRAGYRLHYCKGEYFSVGGGKAKRIQHLIYPVPLPWLTGVGIHATLDMEGRMLLGPSVEYVDSIDYAIDDHNKRMFYDGVRAFLPFIEYDDLAPEMAGVRPKLQGPKDDIRDFVIQEESDRGLPGLINLIGIESPGLTASLAISKYVGGMVDGVLG